MATIEVDGKTIEVENGKMLIEATDAAGIYIPRFCYHEKLSIAANCRMCLVEVEKAPKPLPACATPIMDGMKVFTRSEVAREAQKGTMEFLLINHPLDCPVCDQGGECPLQDQALGYGKDESRYRENKRVVPNPDIGPLVATEMTRCIHCTRCVRFGEEVAGVMEMGAPGRGEFTKIGTFLSRSIDSEVSGNIIDLCPVGALTSKPYRFSARSWELQNHDGISPHDCVGTNIRVQTLRGVVERVLPVENEDVNECWLADRDRYSYEAVNSEERLLNPMIRDGDGWKEVPWQTALQHAVAGLQTVLESGGGADIGALASPSATLEEAYLLQKLMRGLGSNNVDHRLQQQDCSGRYLAPAFPGLELPIADLDQVKAALLVGSNLRKEQPLLSVRIRRAVVRNGAVVGAINVMDYPQNYDLADSVAVARFVELTSALAGIARAVAEKKGVALPDAIAAMAGESAMPTTADALMDAGESGVVIVGANAQQHADAADLRAISQWIADTTGAKLGVLPQGATAPLPGSPAACPIAAPRRIHGRIRQIRGGNAEPGLPGIHPAGDGTGAGCPGWHRRPQRPDAKPILSSRSAAFKSEAALEYADVLLPMAAFTESAGTFINCEGRVQQSTVATHPMGESRPAWKILRVLGNFLEVDGFDQVSLDDVRAEIKLDGLQPNAHAAELRFSGAAADSPAGLQRVTDMPMYRGEPTLRRAAALQHAPRTIPRPAPACIPTP